MIEFGQYNIPDWLLLDEANIRFDDDARKHALGDSFADFVEAFDWHSLKSYAQLQMRLDVEGIELNEGAFAFLLSFIVLNFSYVEVRTIFKDIFRKYRHLVTPTVMFKLYKSMPMTNSWEAKDEIRKSVFEAFARVAESNLPAIIRCYDAHRREMILHDQDNRFVTWLVSKLLGTSNETLIKIGYTIWKQKTDLLAQAKFIR